MSRIAPIFRVLAGSVLLLGAATALGQPTELSKTLPRDPQVHVSGTGLVDYFASVGAQIDPAKDQIVVELLVSHGTFFQIELNAHAESSAIGIYNGHDQTPALYEVFPAHASAGWFAMFSFRSNPTRLQVNTFDNDANLLLSKQYVGADPKALGFYLTGPQGTRYSQDHRNPGGAAAALFYAGTGINQHWAWFGFESGGGSDPDDDFDDAVLFVASPTVCLIDCQDFDLTPVRRVRWGEVKSWYR